MSADEMFEKLGYRQIKKIIKYDSLDLDECEVVYEDKHSKDRIVFWKDCRVEAYNEGQRDDYESDSISVTMDELKAINQKCKELGWLDEC